MLLFGHPIDAMVRSWRNNREILGKRKPLKELYEENGYDVVHSHTFHYKRASRKTLKITHEKMVRENRVSLIWRVSIFILLCIFIFYVFFIFLFS